MAVVYFYKKRRQNTPPEVSQWREKHHLISAKYSSNCISVLNYSEFDKTGMWTKVLASSHCWESHSVQCIDSTVWPICQMEWNQVGLDGFQKMLNKPLRWFGNRSREQPRPVAIQQHWGCALIRNQDSEIHHCCTHRTTPPSPRPQKKIESGMWLTPTTPWIQVSLLVCLWL